MNLIKVILIFLLGLISLAFIRCSGSPSYSEADERFEKEKVQLQNDLEDMRVQVNEKINVMNHKINSASAEGKIRLKVLREKLIDERNDIDTSLTSIKESTSQSWDDIKFKTNRRYNHVKEGLAKIEKDFKDIW